jgi:hypothetical protein
MATSQSISDVSFPAVGLPINLSIQLAWIAGFLEGEGYFGFNNGSVRIVAGQVQRIPLDWCHRMFGGSIRPIPASRWNPNAKDGWQWTLAGTQAAGLMMTLYPWMSPKRQREIGHALRKWRARPGYTGTRHTCPLGHPFHWVKTPTERRRRCATCDYARNRTPERRAQFQRYEKLQRRRPPGYRESRKAYYREYQKRRRMRRPGPSTQLDLLN